MGYIIQSHQTLFCPNKVSERKLLPLEDAGETAGEAAGDVDNQRDEDVVQLLQTAAATCHHGGAMAPGELTMSEMFLVVVIDILVGY